MKQVEELEKKIRKAEEEKEEMMRGREEGRGREYMMRGSGAGGLASRAMGSAVHTGQQGMDNDDRHFIFRTNSNSKVDTDSSISGLRGGMGSCRYMAVGRCGSNRSISSSRCGSNRSISSSRCGSNRSISSRRDSNRISSSYHSLTIHFIIHRPNVGSGGHLIVVLTLLGGTKRNRHPRPTLRWAACTSASGAEDSGIWPRSVPLHSGSKVHAIAVVSMATATTTASSTSTTHTPMLTSLAIQVASAGGAAEICHGPGSNNSSSS